MDEIEKLKSTLQKKNIKGLALDIDETLSGTVIHWMHQMLLDLGNPENLTPAQIIKKYRYPENVPYWQTEKGYQWIEEKRRDNAMQIDIPLVENANHVVEKINAMIPIVAYITARPISIKEGTKKWLQKHNFPLAPLIMAPDEILVEGRSEWKAQVMQYLYPEVLGIVDDNPGFLKFLPHDYKGIVFLYNNDEYNNSVHTVIPCPRWEDVYLQAQSMCKPHETQ